MFPDDSSLWKYNEEYEINTRVSGYIVIQKVGRRERGKVDPMLTTLCLPRGTRRLAGVGGEVNLNVNLCRRVSRGVNFVGNLPWG